VQDTFYDTIEEFEGSRPSIGVFNGTGYGTTSSCLVNYPTVDINEPIINIEVRAYKNM